MHTREVFKLFILHSLCPALASSITLNRYYSGAIIFLAHHMASLGQLAFIFLESCHD
uniref:Tropinone reductase isogeny n=1 Tax=Rhizophora mucronata TaxID=61149 RepID=A0A2P2KDM9_RHIMU